MEQHPELYQKAMEYENAKEGFTWTQHESLEEMRKPERVQAIKEEYIKRNNSKSKSAYLLDVLDDSESEGCASCFI